MKIIVMYINVLIMMMEMMKLIEMIEMIVMMCIDSKSKNNVY